MRSVLICGEGVAGSALAYALERRGVRATVVERAARFEPRGHMISLKGNGVHVLRRLGLYGIVKEHEHAVHTMGMYTPRGTLLRQAPGEGVAAAVGSYLMINRGELHQALHSAAEGRAELRNGAWITALEQAADGVRVVMNDGREERYDLVVGADGVHSKTRDLAFGEGLATPFGADYLAIIARHRHGLDPTEVRAYLGRARSVALIPRGEDRLFATVYHPSSDPVPRGSVEELRPWLLDRYRDFAPGVRRLFESLDQDTWLFRDGVNMVSLPSPVRGRVVLVGDAGFCPTFMSGMGASLALQSAYVLAEALCGGGDLDAALQAYAAAVQPIAARYQDSARIMRKALLDPSWWGSVVRSSAIALLPASVWSRNMQRFYDAERPLG